MTVVGIKVVEMPSHYFIVHALQKVGSNLHSVLLLCVVPSVHEKKTYLVGPDKLSDPWTA